MTECRSTYKATTIICQYDKNDMLDEVPKTVLFDYFSQSNKFTIEVTQQIAITIKVTSEKEVCLNDLYDVCFQVESLLMLFNGRFYPIKQLEFQRADNMVAAEILKEATVFFERRRRYFSTAELYCHPDHVWADFKIHLNTQTFANYLDCINELDITHRAILHMLSDKDIPVDLPCAYLIEVFKPLAELMKIPRNLVADKNDHLVLRLCIKEIIKRYGQDIFATEMTDEKVFNSFIVALVNTRNRIMHIKSNTKPHLNSEECILYTAKIFFLYRRLLLEKMDINYTCYQKKLVKSVTGWNNWDNVLSQCLKKRT